MSEPSTGQKLEVLGMLRSNGFIDEHVYRAAVVRILGPEYEFLLDEREEAP